MLLSQTNFLRVIVGSLMTLCSATAMGIEGITVSDLPRGGDVTVPGRYPIHIPTQLEVLLSGMQTPQAVTLVNKTKETSRVQIFAQHESSTRTLAIQPGTSAVYNFKSRRPIRVKVLSGSIEASSLDPVKIQR
jgi:hypothetical protein